MRSSCSTTSASARFRSSCARWCPSDLVAKLQTRGYVLQGFENELALRAADRSHAVRQRLAGGGAHGRSRGRGVSPRDRRGLCGRRTPGRRPVALAPDAGRLADRRSCVSSFIRTSCATWSASTASQPAPRPASSPTACSASSGPPRGRRTAAAACSARSSRKALERRRRAGGPRHRDDRAGQHLAADVRALRFSGALHPCDPRRTD